jgi:hypothetical protein
MTSPIKRRHGIPEIYGYMTVIMNPYEFVFTDIKFEMKQG